MIGCAEAYEQAVLSMPVELMGERMHAGCMTQDEMRMTVFFLNRERMSGRSCARCPVPFSNTPEPS